MISNNSDHHAAEYLYKAVLTLKTESEVEDFLSDVCTVPEMKALAQRLQVAKMLYTRHVYTDIVEETGASTATISRVNRTLDDGREHHITGNGYRIVLERMGEGPDMGGTRQRGRSKKSDE